MEMTMGTNYWAAPAIFLIDTLISLYIFALMLRFLLQWCGADYQNPLSQFLIRITHPPLRLLRQYIPSAGPLDTAAIVLMLTIQGLGGYLIFLIQGATPSLPTLAIWALIQLLELLLNIYFYAIIIRTLLSWIGPTHYNPALSLLYSLTEPLLQASRRLLPVMGGIDLSPIVPLIGIQMARMLLLPPLQQLALLWN
jgi:YggT family protein